MKLNISLSQTGDAVDTIKMDVPLFIRMMELAREDIKSDAELHNVVERVIAASKSKDTLTMSDYDALIQKESPIAEKQS